MNILKNCVRMSCRYCVEVSMKKVMIFHSGSLESCHKLNFFNIQSTLQIFCVRTHDDLLCSILSCIVCLFVCLFDWALDSEIQLWVGPCCGVQPQAQGVGVFVTPLLHLKVL